MRQFDSAPPAAAWPLITADPDAPLHAGADGQSWQALAADMLPALAGARVLLIGCAAGPLLDRLLDEGADLLVLNANRSRHLSASAALSGREACETRNAALPDALPSGPFDAIVLAEEAVRWSVPARARIASYIRQALKPNGRLVLAHPVVTDAPAVSGDEVHDRWLDSLSLWTVPQGQARTARYRLDDVRLQAEAIAA